jgi:hypothetical protein
MRRALACFPIIAALVAGCGGSSTQTSTHQRSTTSTPTQNSARALQQAVRAAVLANNRLSVYVLWHNEIPGWATQSTNGPALAQLRSSAATRRARGIRIKLLSSRYQVLSIQLDPTYQSAVATIRDNGRVLPYETGRAPGQAVTFKEHARLELHRVGDSPRFLVWQLVAVR